MWKVSRFPLWTALAYSKKSLMTETQPEVSSGAKQNVMHGDTPTTSYVRCISCFS
jgi:hypothetical protein